MRIYLANLGKDFLAGPVANLVIFEVHCGGGGEAKVFRSNTLLNAHIKSADYTIVRIELAVKVVTNALYGVAELFVAEALDKILNVVVKFDVRNIVSYSKAYCRLLHCAHDKQLNIRIADRLPDVIDTLKTT